LGLCWAWLSKPLSALYASFTIMSVPENLFIHAGLLSGGLCSTESSESPSLSPSAPFPFSVVPFNALPFNALPFSVYPFGVAVRIFRLIRKIRVRVVTIIGLVVVSVGFRIVVWIVVWSVLNTVVSVSVTEAAKLGAV
jgi:hypothetical protein